jgi:Tol biopolymer transport system component
MFRKARLWSVVVACFVTACGTTPSAAGHRSASTPPREPQIALSVLSSAVYMVDPGTGRMRALAQGLTDFQAGFAAWSPRGDAVAYGDDGIIVAEPGTGAGRVLVRGPSISMPAWSPDGRSIAYGDGRDLWVTPAITLHATYLHLPLTLAPLEMAWSPSSRIAFEGLALVCHVPFGCSSTSRSDVWTVKPDGSGLRRVTRFGDAEAPRWSRDSTELLFVRRRSATLWTVHADGSDARRVDSATDVVAADWSPDGSRLAVVCRTRDARSLQLWIGGAEGSLRRVGAAVRGTAATLDW